ncbi:MAG: hypothetical protein ABR974_12320 [Bacteroidales bacterium]|jgi:hypothetical protein
MILIFLIIFLIARIFVVMGSASVREGDAKEPDKYKASKKTGVPKELGEYIEFEEVKEKG